ncbi:uncharacterized protein LOC134531354 [Bacillus rossius redtenbacheri]|uniref:uncharacterized protein LOC134531354 n=1 Tax=Bacillus rossius redtenbacheri TaxID=93214 RepID=UPI002FDCD4A4
MPKRAGRKRSRQQGRPRKETSEELLKPYQLGYFTGPAEPSPTYHPESLGQYSPVPYSPGHSPSAQFLFPHPPTPVSPTGSPAPPLISIEVPPPPDRRPLKPYTAGDSPRDPRPQPISARLAARLQELFGPDS